MATNTPQSKFDLNRDTAYGKRLSTEVQRLTKAIEKSRRDGDAAAEIALKAELSKVIAEFRELSRSTSASIQMMSSLTRNIKELTGVTALLEKTQKYHSLTQDFHAAPSDETKSRLLMGAAITEFAEAAHLFGQYVHELLPSLRQGRTTSGEMTGGSLSAIWNNLSSFGKSTTFTPDQVSTMLKNNVENMQGNLGNMGMGKTLGQIGADLGQAFVAAEKTGNVAYKSMSNDDKAGALLSSYEMERRTGNYQSITDAKFLGVFTSQMDALKTIRDNTGVSMEVAKQQLAKDRAEAQEQAAIGTISQEMLQSFTGISSMLHDSGQTKLESLYKRSIAAGGVQNMMVSMDEKERTGLITSPDVMNMLQQLLNATKRGGDANTAGNEALAITKRQQLDLNRYGSYSPILASRLDNGMGAIRSQAQTFQTAGMPTKELQDAQNSQDGFVSAINRMELLYNTTIGSLPGKIVTSIITGFGLVAARGLIGKGISGAVGAIGSKLGFVGSASSMAGSVLSGTPGAINATGQALGSAAAANSLGASAASIGNTARSLSMWEKFAGGASSAAKSPWVKGGGLLAAGGEAIDVFANKRYLDADGNASGKSVGGATGAVAGAGLGAYGSAVAGAAIGTAIGGPLGTILGGIAGMGIGYFAAPKAAKMGAAAGEAVGGLFDTGKGAEIKNDYEIRGSLDSQTVYLTSIKDILAQSLTIQTETYNAIIGMSAGGSNTRLAPKALPGIGRGPDFSGDKATGSISQNPVMPGAGASAGTSPVGPMA